MATGSIHRNTVTSGYLMLNRDFSLTVLQDTGFIQDTDGPGFQIMHGAGHRFITDAGTMITGMAGHGFREMNGAPDGFPGDNATVIMDGHR